MIQWLNDLSQFHIKTFSASPSFTHREGGLIFSPSLHSSYPHPLIFYFFFLVGFLLALLYLSTAKQRSRLLHKHTHTWIHACTQKIIPDK